MAFNCVLSKGTLCHSYNGMPLSSKKKQILGTDSNEDDSQIPYDDSSQTVKVSFISVTFWKMPTFG